MKTSNRVARLLLTNDDGFDAPGLAALTDIAKAFADEIWIVAPEHDQSGTGQSLSLHHPLRCWQRGQRRWAVAGTPADCVGLAVGHLMGDHRPSLILSGINAGSNVGEEVNLSGTLGAAFTGLLLGMPSIAISQDCATRETSRWDTARTIVPKMLRYFLATGWPTDSCLSINIPDLPAEEIKGFSWVRQTQKNIGGIHVDEREDHRQQHYYWLNLVHQPSLTQETGDVAALERGDVTVSRLTNNRSLDNAENAMRFTDMKMAVPDV
jgi:5'-nucleotidase